MAAGRVDTLVVLDANPAYAVPGFAKAMARVPLTLAASRLPDETGAAAKWQLPLSHPLEAWHDWRGPEGTASIAQPLVRPFYDTYTPSEIIDLLADPAASPRSFGQVRDAWSTLDDAQWRAAVATALPPGEAARAERVGPAPLALPAVPAAGMVLDVRPSQSLYDGRFAANAWAQECPDPLTKEVWGSSLRLHPDDLAGIGAADGDVVRVRPGRGFRPGPRDPGASQGGGRRCWRAMVAVMPAPVADGIGGNGWATGPGARVRLTRTGGHNPVVAAQHEFALDRDLAKLFPVLRPGEAMPRTPDRPSLLPNPPARDNAPPQWAMAIDTDVCIGCNACVVACQAENNVPSIGPAEMAVGRDMHWLRVDRYEQPAAAAGSSRCRACSARRRRASRSVRSRRRCTTRRG